MDKYINQITSNKLFIVLMPCENINISIIFYIFLFPPKGTLSTSSHKISAKAHNLVNPPYHQICDVTQCRGSRHMNRQLWARYIKQVKLAWERKPIKEPVGVESFEWSNRQCAMQIPSQTSRANELLTTKPQTWLSLVNLIWSKHVCFVFVTTKK